jgi:plasmid stabilization system protein ParE
MIGVHVEPEAEDDLASIRDWYDALLPGLGNEFLDEFENVSRSISEFPLMYRVAHEEARQAALRRFPYYVMYVHEPDLVSIIAVIHKHRDPGVWRSRLRQP